MHGKPVFPKCDTNQVSALLHYALENLIYSNCGLVTGCVRSECLDKGRFKKGGVGERVM